MTGTLFDNAIAPVASGADARATSEALVPHLRRTGGTAHVVHVIEKSPGALDTTSREQLERDADRMFEAASEVFEGAGVDAFETHVRYGTDVRPTVVDVCDELGASAVVFVTREASRWRRLLSGDVALDLITKNPYPAIVLPEPARD